MPNVFIESGYQEYSKMWMSFGWNVVSDPLKAEVIQFTGGADVSAQFYGEVDHPLASTNLERDKRCFDLFQLALRYDIKMAGICRGGQFLNVANGGSMFQHCDGHAVHRGHQATILDTGKRVTVSSTHHQIMRPNLDKGIVLMVAEKLGTYKEHMILSIKDDKFMKWVIENLPDADDVESVFYPGTMSLCFQPHPEFFPASHECSVAYRYLLRNHLEINV